MAIDWEAIRKEKELEKKAEFIRQGGTAIDWEAISKKKELGKKAGLPNEMDIMVDKTSTILLYILSFLIPFAGFIVGAIYLSKEEEHYKHIGKNCLIYSVMNIVLGVVTVAILFS